MFKKKPKIDVPQVEGQVIVEPMQTIEVKQEVPQELPEIKQEPQKVEPIIPENKGYILKQIKREEVIELKPISDALLTKSIRTNFIWVITTSTLGCFCLLTTALFSTYFIYPSMICMLFALLFSIQHASAVIRKEIRDNAKN
jgi:hypothetical protein